MTSEHFAWQPYDPAEAAPSPLLAEAREEGRTIALAYERSDDVLAWAREAAVSLTREAARHVDRLFLMDLDLERPALHRALGLENDEGATDIFLFGASLRRVAQSVSGSTFYFASAGTATADPAPVLTHERWDRLIRGFREARATLFLFVPLGLPGARELLQQIDRIVLLGATDGSAERDLTGLSDRILLSLRPAEAAVEPLGGPPEDDLGRTDEATVGDAVAVVEEPVGNIEEIAEEAAAEAEEFPEEDVERVAEPPETVAEEEVIDIRDLAPDGAEATEAVWPESEPLESDIAIVADEGVVDIRDLAPDEVRADIEAAPLGAGTPMDDQIPVLPGPVVDIADLAPDLPNEIAQDSRDLEEEFPVQELPSDEERRVQEDPPFQEEPAPVGLVGSGAAPDVERDDKDKEAEGLADFDLDALDRLGESDTAAAAADTASLAEVDAGPIEEAEESEEPDLEADVWPDTAAELDSLPDAGPLAEPGSSESHSGESHSGEPRPSEPRPDEAWDAEGSGDDFGQDLVTGPDFGGGGPDEEDIWSNAPAGPAGGPAGVPAEASAGASAGSRNAGYDREGAPDQGEAARLTTSEHEPEDLEIPRESWSRSSEKDRKSGRPVRLLVLLVLVMIGAVTAHWFGVVRVPGLDRVLASVLGPARTGSAPVVDTNGPVPESALLGYSLVIDSYRDARTAADVALALGARMPDHLFTVSPIQAEGSVSYVLHAGPAVTPVEADELRGPLAAVLTREDPTSWVVRTTPLAFLLGETTDLDAARSMAAGLSDGSVLAYVLQVVYPGSETRYRIYAGAYETAEDGRAMQGILSQEGVVEPRFVERRGSVPE